MLAASQALVEEITIMQEEIPADVVFSLVCEVCDAGSNITCHEQAIAEGWTDIIYAPDLPMANFVGLCPDCKREEEARDSARQ
jgi:hypothetical protein